MYYGTYYRFMVTTGSRLRVFPYLFAVVRMPVCTTKWLRMYILYILYLLIIYSVFTSIYVGIHVYLQYVFTCI